MPCPVGDTNIRYDIVVSSQYWFSLVVSNTRSARWLAFALLRTMPCSLTANTLLLPKGALHALPNCDALQAAGAAPDSILVPGAAGEAQCLLAQGSRVSCRASV